MPDWATYVRRHLRLTGLRREREAEIVEDLARQFEDAYRDARQAGATELDAERRAAQHVSDWDALARQLSASPRQRQPTLDRWTERADDRHLDARRGFTLGAQLRQDLAYGVRALRQHAGLTAVAVLSLALGIGANTAIFSVINALVLRVLPVRDPQQLVVVSDPSSAGMMSGVESGERSLFSFHEFEELRDHNDVLSNTLAFNSAAIVAPVAVGDGQDARDASVLVASGTYFETLGVAPRLGRPFGPDVDRTHLDHPEAIVSDAFWRTRLASDPQALGRTIRVRQTTFTIVGVLPSSFTGLVVGDAPDVWVPVTMQEAVLPGEDMLTQPPGVARRFMFLHVVGRLRPGVTLAQANASLNASFQRDLEAEAALIADPERRRDLTDMHLVVRDASHGLSPLRGEYAQPLVVLLALVGLLLLLACANVANLLLSRAAARERELSVRVALGASRSRLVRQLLTESLLLAGCGATLGLGIAELGTRLLLRSVSDTGTPVPLGVHFDVPVLAFTTIVALVTGIFCGLAPALRATDLELVAVLRGTSRTIAGSTRRPGRWPLGRLLAGAQVAISLLLLVTAGLFIGSLQRLGAVPLGYDPDHLAMFRVRPIANAYPAGAIDALHRSLLARLGTMPGVTAVSLTEMGLFYGGDSGDDVSFPGYTPAPGQEMNARFDLVGPRYFSMLGIPIRVGPDVEPQDAGARVCWLNETMARYFFKDASPIGRHMIVHYSFGDAEYEIRGVVADFRSRSLRSDMARRFYLPYFGSVTKATQAVYQVRTAGDAASVLPAIRSLVREADARLDPPVFHTVRELIDRGLVRDRLTASLSSLFGALALALASLGLYGVLSYGVSRRVGEIGVRMAFGAERASILALVLREAIALTLAGAIVGIVGALAATRLLGALLYGLTARDPTTIAAATLVLLVVAILAAVVPAWRAARTDPLVALRSE